MMIILGPWFPGPQRFTVNTEHEEEQSRQNQNSTLYRYAAMRFLEYIASIL